MKTLDELLARVDFLSAELDQIHGVQASVPVHNPGAFRELDGAVHAKVHTLLQSSAGALHREIGACDVVAATHQAWEAGLSKDYAVIGVPDGHTLDCTPRTAFACGPARFRWPTGTGRATVQAPVPDSRDPTRMNCW